MSDDLLRRLDEWGTAKRLEYLPSLGRQAAARIRELEAERDIVRCAGQEQIDKLKAALAVYDKGGFADADALAEKFIDLTAERDAAQHLSAQADRHRDELLAENERLRAEVSGLRLLLAAGVAGAALYRDDGELQDNTMMPFIDFRRDSPEIIAEKMMQRNKAALKETQ